MPLAPAYRVRENLWVGVELSPLCGHLHNRVPLPEPPECELAKVKYKLYGAGVEGMLGVTWVASEFLALGVGVRKPGAVWLDGSTDYAGAHRDLDLMIEMPTQVFFGITTYPTSRLEISTAVRWTDSSRLGHRVHRSGAALRTGRSGRVAYRPGFDLSRDGRSRLSEGISYGTELVGSEGVSPLPFDSQDVKISAGASYELGAWTFHLTEGYQFEEDRTIAFDEAFILPGRYSNSGAIVLLGVVYQRLGAPVSA